MITGDQFVAEARKFLGDPYVYGGDGPSTFDCSGLVEYSARQLGVQVPRTADDQYNASQHISRAQLTPGDLVFSHWPGDPSSPPVGHVGIWIGNNQILEASHTGVPVHVVPYDASYVAHTIGYGRLKGIGAGSGLTPVTPAGLTNPVGGLLQIPQEILQPFSEAYKLMVAFFQPSTYVRLSAAGFGVIFLLFGLIFLAKAATR